MKPTIFAIDFDGTVVTHDFPKVGKDIGAAPVLKRLIAQGHKLILWTMRSNAQDLNLSGCYLDDAAKWFKDNDIELWGIQRNPEQDGWTSSPKCYAQVYIDDAALGAPTIMDEKVSSRPYIDWTQVEVMLEISGYLPNTLDYGE